MFSEQKNIENNFLIDFHKNYINNLTNTSIIKKKLKIQ